MFRMSLTVQRKKAFTALLGGRWDYKQESIPPMKEKKKKKEWLLISGSSCFRNNLSDSFLF